MLGTLEVGYSGEFFDNVDPDDARTAMGSWAEVVLQKTGIASGSEAFIFPDRASLLGALRSRRVDLVVLLTLKYLDVLEEDLLVAVVGSSSGGSVYREYVLMVRRDSDIENLEQLKGRTLISERGNGGNIPLMWLETLLGRNGLSGVHAFFGPLREESTASRAVLPVFFGQVSACLVSADAFEETAASNPQLTEELKVLARSPEFCRGPICLRKDLYVQYGATMENLLMSLHTYPQGRNLLRLFHVDQLVPFEPAYLESVIELVEEYEQLRGGM